MASALLKSGSLTTKPSFASVPSARGVTKLVVHAEKKSTSVAKVDRSNDTLWFADENSLSYLDGSLPGDYGYDPLGLMAPGGGDVGFINPEWLRYGEIINGRFAMLGVPGMLAPEALGKLGLIPESTRVLWWRTGLFPFAGTDYEYWADPYTLFFIMLIAMHFAELRRMQDYRNPGSMGKQFFLGLEQGLGGSGDPAYPGGLFNPLGFGNNNEEAMRDLKVKEIKNGRLAMVAFLGFACQAVLTGKGPVQNWLDHLADPFGNNILTNFAHVYGS